jgi:outer membrane protein TolC
MKKTARFSGSMAAACFGAALFLGTVGTAQAKGFKLDELLDMARKGNPGLQANAQVTAGAEAQALGAYRSRFPTGELTSTLAPMTEIRCRDTQPHDPNTPAISPLDNCTNTNFYFQSSSTFDAITNIKGIFTRTEVKLVQPIYTFGKIDAGITAAEAGVEATRSQQSGKVNEVELSVRKAYWGAKLARELLSMLNEGIDYLTEAQKKIDQELAEGEGNASVTDRLRLRTMRAEIEARVLEAQRGADLAKAGLRALIGPSAPTDLDVDDDPLATLTVPTRELGQYTDLAHTKRPEVRALDQLVAAKRALADLEWRRQLPDFFLVGTAQYAYANSVDHPNNAFAYNPFNTSGAGLAAGLRVPLDLFVKNASAHKLRAEAQEAEFRRSEALGGIKFEVEKSFAEMKEADLRLKALQKGEKASRQWIAAIMQNISVGLAETKDFSDALLAFFQSRARVLQGQYDYNVAVASMTRVSGTDVTAKD